MSEAESLTEGFSDTAFKGLKRISRGEGLDVLKVWEYDLPELEYLESVAIVEAAEDLKEAKRKLEFQKAQVAVKVIDEKDGEGKLRYPNQVAREAAIVIASSRHPVVLAKIAEVFEATRILELAKARRDAYSKNFGIVKNEVYHLQKLQELSLKKDADQAGVKP